MKKLPILFAVFFLTTAHSGRIDYGDGWAYESWEEEQGSSVFPVFSLQYYFTQYNQVNFTCKNGHREVNIIFMNLNEPIIQIDPEAPVIYSFDKEPPKVIKDLRSNSTGEDLVIDDQETAKILMNRMHGSKLLLLEFRQQSGFAHTIGVDLSKMQHILKQFKRDCDRHHD